MFVCQSCLPVREQNSRPCFLSPMNFLSIAATVECTSISRFAASRFRDVCRFLIVLDGGAVRGKRAYFWAARLDHVGMGLLRLGLVIVLLWIGGLKFAGYEADSIVPLVGNSPFGSFLYHHRPPEYRHYMNKEGEVVPAHQ